MLPAHRLPISMLTWPAGSASHPTARLDGVSQGADDQSSSGISITTR